MASDTKHLALRPAAETETIEDLFARVNPGLIRIPTFQRPLRWDAGNVTSLFDSIYKGYPIGSFLFQKGAAGAARLEIGPLKIDAPETSAALWEEEGSDWIPLI